MQRFLLILVLLISPAIVSAKTVLVLGDSLSAAYNMKVESGWVNLLRERIAPTHQVYNASISGDTSAGGLARLPVSLDTHDPDIVVLELGANDGLRGLPLAQLRRNLGRMIELSEARGAKVIIAGMQLPPNYGPFYTNKFHQIYTDLQAKYDIDLIPFLLDGVGGVEGLIQADGLHPNEMAQPIILENVWLQLQKHLKP